jgi:NodT family efflux transporter outer membrane factor (OMF) lipoprotein
MRGEFSCSALLLALALSAGCTSWGEYKANGCKVGPNYCRPNAAVAEHWIDADDQRLSSEEPDLSCWWTTFNDPTLDDLIHAAQAQNLTLREAGFRILQARAVLAIQMGNLFPQTQQAFGGYTRNAISTLAANQQFLPERFFSNNALGFNLSWELDFWGRFRRAIIAAADDLDASVFDYDDVLVTLLGDVASTYVEIRTLQQQLEYTRDNIKIQQESLDIAEARFKGGLSSELDVEQAISQLAQTEANIPALEKQLRQANDRLCILLGIPTEDLVKCMAAKKIPAVEPNVVVGIPCNLLCRRPDVRRAERLAAAQCEQIGIAVTDLYPAISITGTVSFEAERFTNLFKDHSLQGSVGPGFKWNVLNYGRLVNNVRLQDARFMELVMAYRNTVITANSEVEDGIVEFLQSQVQAKSLQRSVDAADKAVQLAITQYRAGLVDFNRVALLEQNLVQQQDLLAQSQGDIALGLVRTYRALGGGWDDNCGGSAPPQGYAAMTGDHPEELPPGKSQESPRNGSKSTAPRPATPPANRNRLPGPNDTNSMQSPQNDVAAKSRNGRFKAAGLRTQVFDKPMQLRYADEHREVGHDNGQTGEPDALDYEKASPLPFEHAGLLPEDHGEIAPLRR